MSWAKPSQTAIHERWRRLTWQELESWTDDRSLARGRDYQQNGAVEYLAVAADGRLLARVQGNYCNRYITSVWWEAGKPAAQALQSECSCPVGYGCKHAVAAIAEYLQALADRAAVPPPDLGDLLWEYFSPDTDEPSHDRPMWLSGWTQMSDQQILNHLAERSQRENIDLLMSLFERLPKLGKELQKRLMRSDE